jgi:hypothetical protein
MKRYFFAALLLLAPSLAAAASYIGLVPQNVATTNMDTAVTAVVPCSDAATDYSAVTPTNFPCRNTGAVSQWGFDQVTVQVKYVHVAGTAVNMQCATSENATTGPWYTVQQVDSTGASTARTWTKTRSLSGAWSWNFSTDSAYVRCWFWITSGTSDTLALKFRQASTAPAK